MLLEQLDCLQAEKREIETKCNQLEEEIKQGGAKIVFRDVPVEKIVYVEKIVEKIVHVPDIKELGKHC